MRKIALILSSLLIHHFLLSQTVIKMKSENGVSVIPCKVNGLKLNFIFDTGASNVSISATEAWFMLKNDYLDSIDIIGTSNFQDATGKISEGVIINLKEIEIGNIKLYNVKASVVTNIKAPLLLGQSAIAKLGKIEIDLATNTLKILNSGKTIQKNKIAEQTDASGFIENKPMNDNDYIKIINTKLNRKDYEGVITICNKIIEINSASSAAFIYRGLSKKALKDYLGAIEDCNMAIELSPNAPSSYLIRGNAKSQLMDYSGAIFDYDMAIKLGNETAGIYDSRGNAKYNLQNYSGAIANYDVAIKLNSNNSKYYYNRGIAKKDMDDYSGANSDFSIAIKLSPNNSEYYGLRGLVKLALKNYLGAITDFNMAIKISPNYADYYFDRGTAKLAMNYLGTINDYNVAIKLNSKYSYDPDFYYNRGLAKIELGQKESGCIDLNKAKDLGSRDADDLIKRDCK